VSVVWPDPSGHYHDAGSDYACEYEYGGRGDQECRKGHQKFVKAELGSRGWPGCLGTGVLHYLYAYSFMISTDGVC